MPHENTKLILASQSPRRRELLRQAGYEFEVVEPSPEAECGLCSGESPAEMVARLARQKAADVAPRVEQGIVIGCDTVAECMGRILGKPADPEHAREMLHLLRGRTHSVLSGLCLWHRPTDRAIVEVDVTQLRMDELSDPLIEEYLDSEAWEGKAGAFGFQDRLGWIHVIEGSISNVVGLPMERLAAMLERLRDPN